MATSSRWCFSRQGADSLLRQLRQKIAELDTAHSAEEPMARLPKAFL
jgi:hypothetical protein